MKTTVKREKVKLKTSGKRLGFLIILGRIYSGGRMFIEKFLNILIVIKLYNESQEAEHI